MDQDEDGIWADHVTPFNAFLTVQTQWRVAVAPMGDVLMTGLDYSGVEAGLRQAGIDLTPAQFADLQMIERGAIEALEASRRQVQP